MDYVQLRSKERQLELRPLELDLKYLQSSIII